MSETAGEFQAQVWCIVGPSGKVLGVYRSRRAAEMALASPGWVIKVSQLYGDIGK